VKKFPIVCPSHCELSEQYRRMLLSATR